MEEACKLPCAPSRRWAVAQEGAKIVNLSLGHANDAEVDPLKQAVNALSGEYGVLFVAAAGNSGQPGRVSDAPADRTSYRLVASASQSVFPLSSGVTAEWEFASEYVAG